MANMDKGDDVARIAAEVGSKAALEFYMKEKQKERRRYADRRLRNTKRLMKSYNEIKLHAGDAIASLAEIEGEDFDFFRSIMEEDSSVNVAAIVRSKARSAIMLAHIDAMLEAYRKICLASKRPEDQRRYRILALMCLGDTAGSATDIAKRENIDIRTVYKDLDAACEKMSALLFGIQWMER